MYTELIQYRRDNPLKKCGDVYTELHHVVPKCLGGSNKSSNLIRLTFKEHLFAHKLLAKIHPEVPGLSMAVLFMLRKYPNRNVSSRQISLLRVTAVRETSDRMTNLWKTESFKQKMMDVFKSPEFRAKHSENSKQMWCSLSRRETHSSTMKRHSQKQESIKRFEDSKKKVLLENPWPWQRARAQPTRQIWTFAASFWELSFLNEETADSYTYTSFCRYFFEGKYTSIFRNMEGLFKDGWNPLECDEWLKEFGHKM